MLSFANDYTVRPHPVVRDAWEQTFLYDADGAYGQDSKTIREVTELLQVFKGAASVFYVNTGTAANQLALRSLLHYSHESVICAHGAHVDTYECGALEASGHKVLSVDTDNEGKVTPEVVEAVRSRHRRDIHLTFPKVLSIANATESGTVYSLDDLVRLREYTQQQHMLLHIDGARYAYAGPRSISLSDLSRFADVFSFGGTKVGAEAAEAVIFSDGARDYVPAAVRIHKQMGQLVARPQGMAVQIGALLQEGLWLGLANIANDMARHLAEALLAINVQPLYPVQTNMVFVRMPFERVDNLPAQMRECLFDEERRIFRFVCSWYTTEEDIDSLLQLVETGSLVA